MDPALESVTRTPNDQFGKQMLLEALAEFGPVQTDAESPAEARRVDVWFTPDAARGPLPEHLGLLGQLLAGPTTVELCHNTPDGDELADYFIKHGQFRRYLAARKPPPPVPLQWVISAGCPKRGIAGLRIVPRPDLGAGIYEGPPLLWTRLIVVSELPVRPDTLLLRLLGRGTVFRDAIAELKALAPDAPEHRLAFPLLLRYWRLIAAKPMPHTTDDQEFLMATQDIVETFRQEAIREGERTGFDKGAREGFDKGERTLLLRQLRRRFGAKVDGLIELRLTTASREQIERWADRVLTAATLADVFAD